jgi:hypothetical protein
MNLNFESDNFRSKLIRGYPIAWNLSKNNGSYNSGKDFISVHWEVHYDSPDVVRLDVEAPVKTKDIELNFLKQRIIIAILSKTQEVNNALKLGEFQIASRLFNTHMNKSSEVFHVKICKDNVLSNHKENISQVHSELGNIIESVILKFSEEFKIFGLKQDTCP